MNYDEFKMIAKGMKAVYTSDRFLPDKESFNIWYQLLKDIPYQVANVAVQKYMLSNKFPPTVAELRAETVKATHGEAKDWGEAWEGVCVAIRKYGSYSENEALESLEPITRQAVKRLGFKNLCMSENAMADRANFRMIYEQLSEREANKAQLPEGLLNQIEAIQKGKELEHDEKERRLLGG